MGLVLLFLLLPLGPPIDQRGTRCEKIKGLLILHGSHQFQQLGECVTVSELRCIFQQRWCQSIMQWSLKVAGVTSKGHGQTTEAWNTECYVIGPGWRYVTLLPNKHSMSVARDKKPSCCISSLMPTWFPSFCLFNLNGDVSPPRCQSLAICFNCTDPPCAQQLTAANIQPGPGDQTALQQPNKEPLEWTDEKSHTFRSHQPCSMPF